MRTKITLELVGKIMDREVENIPDVSKAFTACERLMGCDHATMENAVEAIEDTIIAAGMETMQPQAGGEGIEEAAIQAYEGLSNFANAYRTYAGLLGKEFTHDHPLLQAYVMGIFLEMVDAMAENPRVSPQNENTVKLCKQIQAAIGEYPQYL